MKRYLLILISAVLSVNLASARDILQLPEAGDKSVYLNFEFDPTFFLSAGFATVFEISPINRNLQLSAEIALPIFLLDLKHYAIELSTKIPIIGYNNWQIINRFSFANKGTDNGIFKGNSFQLEEGLLLGYFAEKWHAAFDISYMKILATHMVYSDFYRDHYPGAVDGWYKGMGGNIYFSVVGGVTIKERVGIALRAGIYRTEKFNEPSYVPFVVNVGVNYIF